MLRQLWKAAIVLRYRPVVWIPFILAESASVLLAWMRRRMGRMILEWVTERRSVLGGESHVSLTTPGVLHTAFLWSSPIGFTLQFVQVFILALAFLLTVRFVQRELGNVAPDRSMVRRALHGYPKRILWFSCLLSFWSFVVVLAGSSIFSWGKAKYFFENIAHSPDLFVPFVTLIWALILAWIIAPFAIRFLMPRDAPAVDPRLKQAARRLAMLCALFNLGLYNLYEVLRARVRFSSAFSGFAAGWAAALIADIPWLLFFVASGLLIAEPTEMSDPVIQDMAE